MERGSYDLDGCGALGGELGGLEGSGCEGCFVEFSAMMVRGLDIVMVNLLIVGKNQILWVGDVLLGLQLFAEPL